VLKAIPGSLGVTRNFNGAGQIVYRGNFGRGGDAVLTVQVP
jgi:hypothetical protein